MRLAMSKLFTIFRIAIFRQVGGIFFNKLLKNFGSMSIFSLQKYIFFDLCKKNRVLQKLSCIFALNLQEKRYDESTNFQNKMYG